jgi:hypothetical protein
MKHALVLAMALGAMATGAAAQQPMPSEEEKALLRGMDKAMADVNRTLPRETTPGVTLVNTSRQGKVVYSDSRIPDPSVTKGDVQALRPQFIKVGCANKEMREGMMKYGVSFVYRYSDKNDKPITQITISGDDCK